MCIITVRKRSCRKVKFSQACVKNSVQGEVYSPWVDTPLGRHLPWADKPPGRHPQADFSPGQTHHIDRYLPPSADTHPWADTPGKPPPPQGRRLLQRTVRILLECIIIPFHYFIISNLQLTILIFNILFHTDAFVSVNST